MYDSFSSGVKITLWCDWHKQSDTEKEREEPQEKQTWMKRFDDIFHKLKENNPEMAAPKLCLWAKLIQTGRHESYEVPPPTPLITGPYPSKDKKDTLIEAFSGAVSAIVKAVSQCSHIHSLLFDFAAQSSTVS